MTVKNRNEYIPVHTPCGEISRTKQSFKDDCDINLIVKRHAQTGLWDHLNPAEPSFGDFTAATELREAIELNDTAFAEFMQLPAAVRAVVENDPVLFLQAIEDPDSFHELVEAGLPVVDTYKAPVKAEPEPPIPQPTPAPNPAPIAGGE